MSDKESVFIWTNWQRFSKWKNVSHVPKKLGVYQVRACSADGVPVPIDRCCGVDEDGLLYVGEGNVHVRLGLLQYLGLSDGKHHHHFIATFENYGLGRIADRELTEVRWAVITNCKQAEKKLIEDYKQKFGDLPPGNLKLGG